MKAYINPTVSKATEYIKFCQCFRAGNGYVTLSYEVSEYDGYDYKEGFTGLVRNR